MADTNLVAPSGNADIDGLLSPVKWESAALTYSFPAQGVLYEPYIDESPRVGFKPLTSAQQAAATDALGMWAAVANLRFTAMTESADAHATLRFARTDHNTKDHAWSHAVDGREWGGDNWFSNETLFDNPIRGNYAQFTFLHEIGHSLGLKHPHTSGESEFGTGPAERDALAFTAMSYHAHPGAVIGVSSEQATASLPQTPMMNDIAAMQYMYGANFAHNAGDTVYRWDPTTGENFINGTGQGAPANRIFMTVWDGGGSDTYDFSNYTAGVVGSLKPGEWTTTSNGQLADLGGGNHPPGTIANALLHANDPRSMIENVLGSAGDDNFTGNTANNFFLGGAGNDRFDGWTGFDTASFTDKTASVLVALSPDKSVTARVGEGEVDTLRSVENVWGGTGADTLTGDGSPNFLWGFDGNDVIRGGGGIDILNGGNGVDTVDFSDRTRAFSLLLSQDPAGTRAMADGVAGDYVLAFENIIGGGGGDFLVGDDLANEIRGGGGGNIINGRGGNDILWGSEGGGEGSQFVFDTPLDATNNVDQFRGFTPNADKMQLNKTVFTALGEPGTPLEAGQFRSGPAAVEADDRIIYDPGTGALVYDANGNVAGGDVAFATMVGGPALSATDFVIA